MALSQQEILETRKRLGIPEGGINSSNPDTSAAQNVARRRQLAAEYDAVQAAKAPKKSFFQETKEDIMQTGRNLKETFTGTVDKVKEAEEARLRGEQGFARTRLQTVGAMAGGVSKGIGDVVTGVAKTVLPEKKEEVARSTVKSTLEAVAPVAVKIDETLGSPVGTFINKYSQLDDKTKRDVDALLGIGSLALDVATGGTGKKVAQKGIQMGTDVVENVAKTAAQTAKEVAETGFQVTKRATEKVMQKVGTPAPTPLKAAGEILQGATDDVARGIKGLSTLDTEGVKTFKDLGSKIKSKITELARQVDDDLGRDTTKTLLDNLGTSAKTKAGTMVTSNPVKTALGQLQELYTKIGDVVGAEDIKELIQTAKTSGLTKAEVNDIARLYGQEFGEKAFSKMGDPLTSVNAQLYENTRKAIKDVARSGLGGDAAKAADKAMSTLYDTERLIKKNIEAVNKLQQRIQERGLLEKIGHGLAKYGDLLTGGTIRGFVGGLLPRGAGYKIMNALDLEEALAKNLKILQDAVKSGSDAEIEAILKNLKF